MFKKLFRITDNTFVNQHTYVWNKANVYAGIDSPPTLLVDPGSAYFTTVPVVTYDTNLSALYPVTEFAGSPGQLRVSTITGLVDSPICSTNAFFNTANSWEFQPFNRADFAPQLD